jgi:flagellar M-ring protein FliF
MTMQTKDRTPQEIEQLRLVVMNALGLKAAPGQSLDSLVTLQEQQFQAVDTLAATAPLPLENRVQNWSEVASKWSAVVGAGIVLLMFWRMFKRQKPEAVPMEVLSYTPEQASRALPNANNVTPELLNELIRQKPANIGVALREWVTAGAPSAPASKN